MALSSKLSKFQILKEIWLDFEQDFFDSETIEDKTPMFLILITMTHLLSILIVSTEPLFVFCNGFSRAFSMIELGSIYFWIFSLLAIYLIYRCDRARFLKYVRYLYIAGFAWIPFVGVQWFECVAPTVITRASGPPFVMNYAPRILNACFNQSTSCYNSYLLRHVLVLAGSLMIYDVILFLRLLHLHRVLNIDAHLPGATGVHGTSSRSSRYRDLRSLSDPSIYCLVQLGPQLMDPPEQERPSTSQVFVEVHEPKEIESAV